MSENKSMPGVCPKCGNFTGVAQIGKIENKNDGLCVGEVVFPDYCPHCGEKLNKTNN